MRHAPLDEPSYLRRNSRYAPRDGDRRSQGMGAAARARRATPRSAPRMSQPPAALTPPSTGGAIRRNAVYSLLSQIVGAAFTAGLTLFLARRLGTHGFGVYSLALGIGSLVLFPMDCGISTSMARFVAEH